MKIAICGVTGAVGKEVLRCIKDLSLQYDTLDCYASANSAGKTIESPLGNFVIRPFTLEACSGYDLIFLCVSGSFSARYAEKLLLNNRYVIDNSSNFRYDDQVPLVIPEINFHTVKNHRLIANPNCTTAILSLPLYPIYQAFGLKRIIVSTYQATSGGGQAAMDELREESLRFLQEDAAGHHHFVHPIPFNLIPAIDTFQPNGYTREEMKVVWETQKIFEDDQIKISATAVRVPTFRAHAESITLETAHPIDMNKVYSLLGTTPGVTLVDDPENHLYPMPITASGNANVEVGRIRKNNVFGENGLDLFICGDQLLKGAALNAVQIAQHLFK